MNEKQVYSQQGEDGVISYILSQIGETSGVAVDIGAYDGITTSNTHLLKEQGWRTVQFEGGDVVFRDEDVIRAWVTPENIIGLLEQHDVPREYSLLSLDIDSIDWWVMKSMLESGYRPKVAVTEINVNYGPVMSRVLNPEKQPWGAHYGATLLAYYYLMRKYEYSLVYMENNGVNAFWVRDDLMQGTDLVALTPPEAYKPPKYGIEYDGMFLGHEDRGEAGDMMMVLPDLSVR